MIKEFFGKTQKDALAKASMILGIPSEKISFSAVGGEFRNSNRESVVSVLVEVADDWAPGSAASSSVGGSQIPLEFEKWDELQSQKGAGGAAWAEAFVGGVFSRMGLRSRIEIQEEEDHTVLFVDLEKDAIDLKRGEARDLRSAIQHLVNRSMAVNGDQGKRVIVDIGRSLEERGQQMQELAKELAGRVLEGKMRVYLHMMDAQDRRIVHTSIDNLPGLRTTSQGDQSYRILGVEAAEEQEK